MKKRKSETPSLLFVHFSLVCFRTPTNVLTRRRSCLELRENPKRGSSKGGDRGRETSSTTDVASNVVAAGRNERKQPPVNSLFELDQGLALAGVALDGHDGPIALALVADVRAPGVLRQAGDAERVARLHLGPVKEKKRSAREGGSLTVEEHVLNEREPLLLDLEGEEEEEKRAKAKKSAEEKTAKDRSERF